MSVPPCGSMMKSDASLTILPPCTHVDAQHNGASTSSPDDRRHTSYFHYTVRAWLHIFSLCMHCERYGAREGRARSEMGGVLPGFCRRTYMPVVNRFSQAATYTRTWGTWRYAFLFKEDQVDQSLSTQARTRICRPKRLESKCAPAKHANRYSPPHPISISSRLEL